jgi:hypothetical protein
MKVWELREALEGVDQDLPVETGKGHPVVSAEVRWRNSPVLGASAVCVIDRFRAERSDCFRWPGQGIVAGRIRV